MSLENSHAEMVTALKKEPLEIVHEMTGDKADLIHMVMGVSGEAGELLDAIKKHVMYNKPLDLENVIEELGDLEFYIEGIRQTLGVSREDTLNANMQKLGKRYSSGSFSNQQAQNRADKEGE